jgi:hypothetical protein
MSFQVNNISYLQLEGNHNMANSIAKLNLNTRFLNCSNFNLVGWHQPKSEAQDSTYESRAHAPQAVTVALSGIANTTMQVDSVAALVRACRDTVVEMGNWIVGDQLFRMSCAWSGGEARRLLLRWHRSRRSHQSCRQRWRQWAWSWKLD